MQEKTGLLIDAYFSASKIRWILDHVRRRAGARRGRDSSPSAPSTRWLIWKLTGGRQHVTDVTNASRTMLFNIHTLAVGRRAAAAVRRAGEPAARGPQSRARSTATTSDALGLGQIPIAGIAGDQQAALFGQMCRTPGMSKNTYGTGCFLLQNIGTTPTRSRNQLLTTVAWQIGGRTEYALEGSVFIGGAVVQWLRDGLGLIRTAAEIEPLALERSRQRRRVPGAGVRRARRAALGSVRARHASSASRAARPRDISRAQRSRASRSRSPTCSMRWAPTAASRATELRVDGGAAANNMLMQIQADLLGVPVVRPAVTETTALGAAYLAGLARGFLELGGRTDWAMADGSTIRTADERAGAARPARPLERGRRARQGLGDRCKILVSFQEVR